MLLVSPAVGEQRENAEQIIEEALGEDQEEPGERVRQLLAVMALGVMEHDWKKNPPRYPLG